MDGNGGKSSCLMFVTLNSVLEKVCSGVTQSTSFHSYLHLSLSLKSGETQNGSSQTFYKEPVFIYHLRIGAEDFKWGHLFLCSWFKRKLVSTLEQPGSALKFTNVTKW